MHNGLHAFGRFAVRVLVHGGEREGFAEALEYVDRDLGGHVDAVGDQSSVRGGTVARVRVARAGAVDPTLGTGRECHGGDFEGEAEGHACDGRKGDPAVAEEGVEEVCDKGHEDHDGDGVYVRENVVWDAVGFHVGCLRDGVCGQLVLAQGEDDDGNAACLLKGNARSLHATMDLQCSAGN